MERFTEKNKDGSIRISDGINSHNFCDERLVLDRAIKKLSQLEDIEEELKIDLTIPFKALRDGIYLRELINYVYPKYPKGQVYDNNHPYYIAKFKIVHYDCVSINTSEILYASKKNVVGLYSKRFDEYGETWALTKEELKNKGE